MTLEEFKLIYCYDISEGLYGLIEKEFEAIYCFDEGLMEYPELENPKMIHDKYEYIDKTYRKYQDQTVLDTPINKPLDINIEGWKQVFEFLSMINKKMNEGDD